MTERVLWSPLGDNFVTSRTHLHQLAFFAVSPSRYDAVGRMGLRPTPLGFGTPEFEGKVARVQGIMLVLEEADKVATQLISTVRAAARFFGHEYREVWFEDFHDPPAPLDPDSQLEVEEADSMLIGEWFAFGFEVLGRMRSRASGSDDASPPQIWPEHFDAAIEVGDSNRGQRASYGLSPGDSAHDEPYAYIAPWEQVDRGDSFWNDEAFNGASLGYEVLSGPGDPAAACLSFFNDGYRRLQA